jgi:hypothetical protein
LLRCVVQWLLRPHWKQTQLTCSNCLRTHCSEPPAHEPASRRRRLSTHQTTAAAVSRRYQTQHFPFHSSLQRNCSPRRSRFLHSTLPLILMQSVHHLPEQWMPVCLHGRQNLVRQERRHRFYKSKQGNIRLRRAWYRIKKYDAPNLHFLGLLGRIKCKSDS